MLRHLLVLLLFTFCLSAAFSQNIIIQEGDFKQQDNGDIYLRMSIEQKSSPRERYNIKLYRSFNGANFQPLSITRNDVAPSEPVIFTLSASDLGGTGSQLQLRVEIEASVFPLVVRAPSKVKKGKTLSASWSGYNTNGPYSVELIDDLGRSIMIGDENSTSINRQLDKDLDKGTYTLRVTPDNNKASYGEATIKIAGGSPILWIAAPVVLGGGAAAYFLLGGEDGGDGGGTPEPGGLPEPPDTP